jgi:hypothetical protein
LEAVAPVLRGLPSWQDSKKKRAVLIPCREDGRVPLQGPCEVGSFQRCYVFRQRPHQTRLEHSLIISLRILSLKKIHFMIFKLQLYTFYAFKLQIFTFYAFIGIKKHFKSFITALRQARPDAVPCPGSRSSTKPSLRVPDL